MVDFVQREMIDRGAALNGSPAIRAAHADKSVIRKTTS